MRYKKVAIIHDVLIEWGGAERVLLSLLRLFPHADMYIPLMTEAGKNKIAPLSTGKIHTSFFNSIPFISSASILLKPFLYLYWESLDLTTYDLVISSSHSFSSKSVITSPFTTHLSYIHTPPRYLYTEYNETRVTRSRLFKFLFAPMMNWLRVQDFIGGQRPDTIVANSNVVQRRIEKYYRRKSTVIFPPITLAEYKPSKKKNDKKYFLCFSRLAKQKGIDLAIQACNNLKLPLLIVGQGAEEKYLKSLAGPTISFSGYVSDTELPVIFSQAYALINCAKEEDFGLVNVESLHFGVPVIGYDSGAMNEIIEQGKTGFLFSDYSVESLETALVQFQKKRFSAQECINRAKMFSETIFHKKLTKLLST